MHIDHDWSLSGCSHFHPPSHQLPGWRKHHLCEWLHTLWWRGSWWCDFGWQIYKDGPHSWAGQSVATLQGHYRINHLLSGLFYYFCISISICQLTVLLYCHTPKYNTFNANFHSRKPWSIASYSGKLNSHVPPKLNICDYWYVHAIIGRVHVKNPSVRLSHW